MSPTDIIRAWKDSTYLSSLTADERVSLPPHPAGELSDLELASITGASENHHADSQMFTACMTYPTIDTECCPTQCTAEPTCCVC